ncbi:EF-hand domain-containing protein [Streptomyces sp. NPDC059008]|uniref:EF-hand domain-containing protein n=1 Tax=Streptomyces sp. NPDC059008 TaxID=3346693 RepID=UPI0036CF67A0
MDALEAREAFAALDRDGDGRLTVEEWQQAVVEYYTPAVHPRGRPLGLHRTDRRPAGAHPCRRHPRPVRGPSPVGPDRRRTRRGRQRRRVLHRDHVRRQRLERPTGPGGPPARAAASPSPTARRSSTASPASTRAACGSSSPICWTHRPADLFLPSTSTALEAGPFTRSGLQARVGEVSAPAAPSPEKARSAGQVVERSPPAGRTDTDNGGRRPPGRRRPCRCRAS